MKMMIMMRITQNRSNHKIKMMKKIMIKMALMLNMVKKMKIKESKMMRMINFPRKLRR